MRKLMLYAKLNVTHSFEAQHDKKVLLMLDDAFQQSIVIIIIKSMNQLRRNTKQLGESSADQIHTFSLKLICPPASRKQSGVTVHFATNSSKDIPAASLIPQFNNDRRCFTPAFSLGVQKSLLDSDAQAMKKSLEQRVKMSVDEPKGALYEPKPSSTYCSVCREEFDDYLRHVSHPVHLRKLEESKYSLMINALIQNFKEVNEGRHKRLNCMDDDDDLQIQKLSKSYKKIKTQYPQELTKTCKDINQSTNCSVPEEKSRSII